MRGLSTIRTRSEPRSVRVSTRVARIDLFPHDFLNGPRGARDLFCLAGSASFQARKDFPFLFIDKTSRIVVGCGGLHRPRWAVPVFELGFWGRSSLVGRGLFSEAAHGLANYAFSRFGAKRVEAICDDLNARSIRLCERIGMQLEGVLRQERRAPDGSLRNTRVYSKLA